MKMTKMKTVHNESGDCSCTSCINKRESSRTSLKRILRTGSRTNKLQLHLGNKLPAKDKKILDKLVLTRKHYDTLRNKLLSSSSGDCDCQDGPSSAVLEVIKLVDKGEASEHNPLGECCSCCICESLRARATHKRHRQGHSGSALSGRTDYSSRSSMARHRDRRRRKVHYDAKQVHSDPCTCTLQLRRAIKKRSREMIQIIRRHEKSTENGREERPEKMRALKKDARRTIKAIRESRSRFQLSNPDVSSEVVRVARDKIIRDRRKARKGNLREDLDDIEPMYSKKVRKSAKTRLKESVEKLAQRSAEKIKDLETKRKLGHRMCECPETVAGLTKMAKQNLNRQNMPPEEQSAWSEIHELNTQKSGQRIANLVRESKAALRENVDAIRQKSALTIKQIEAKRKALRSICECTLFRTAKLRLKKSSEKISEQFKDSQTKLKEHVKGFRIRKDSKTKYREALVKKKELKEWECDIPCYPEECVPLECYEKILARNERKKGNKKIGSIGTPTVTLKVGVKNKKSSNSSCQCEKRTSKSIYSFVSFQDRKSKQTSVLRKKKEKKIQRRSQKAQGLQNSDCQCKKPHTKSVYSTTTSQSSTSEVQYDNRREPPKGEVYEKPEREKSYELQNIEPESRPSSAVRISSSFSFEIEFSKGSGKLKLEQKAKPKHERSQAFLESPRILHRKVKQTQKTGRFKPSNVYTSKATKTPKQKLDIVHYRSSSTSTNQMKSTSSMASRFPRSPNKRAQTRLKQKERSATRSVVRISSTFKFDVEFSKDQNGNIGYSQNPQNVYVRDHYEQKQPSISRRTSFSERSNGTLLRKKLLNCVCALKFNNRLHNKQKILKNNPCLCKETIINYMCTASDTFNRRAKTTYSFSSRSMKSPRDMKVQSVGLIHKNKKGTYKKNIPNGRKVNRGAGVEPVLKRCFCTLNLPTRGKSRPDEIYKQQTYTVSRVAVENKKKVAKALTTKPKLQNKSLLIESPCSCSKLSSTCLRPARQFPLNKLKDIKYSNTIKTTSICLLPKENSCFSSSCVLSSLELNKKIVSCYKINKNNSLLSNQSLRRCSCAFHLQMQSNNGKQTIKPSYSNHPTWVKPTNSKKDQSKSKLSKRNSSRLNVSNSQFRKSQSQCRISKSDQDLRLQSLKLAGNPYSGIHTVYRQALLPYECEPNICIPGECDPYECLKLIKKRTRDGRTQSRSAERKSTSTESKGAHMNEGLQVNSDFRKHVASSSGSNSAATSPSRQAVRIGSSFKVSVEFFKDNTETNIPERRDIVKQEPIPRNVKATGVAVKHGIKDSGCQNCRKCHNKHSQKEHAAEERSTMTTSLLRRCFCTAKLLGYKVKPQPVQKETGEAGTITKKYQQKKIKPEKVTSETGIQLNQTKSFLEKCKCFIKNINFRKKQNRNLRNLDPNECEPGFCIPGACDPYVCLDRIKKRKYDSGVNTEMFHKKSKAVMHKPHKAPKGQTMQTVKSRDNANEMTKAPRTTGKRDKQQVRHGPYRKQEIEQLNTGKQAVRIGSNFSFSVEFFKDGSERQHAIETPVHTKIRRKTRATFTPRIDSVNIKHGTTEKATKTKKIQSMINTTSRCFCTLSLNKKYHKKKGPVVSLTIPPNQNIRKKRRSQGSVGNTQNALIFLKRCFCTSKFQNNNKSNVKATRTSTSTKIHEKFLEHPKVRVTKNRNTSTNKYKQNLSKLEPHQCEPGVCVPGKCDPYECLKRIKKREVHSRASRTDPTFRVDRGSLSSRDLVSKGVRARRIRDSHEQKHKNIGQDERPVVIHREIKSVSAPNRQVVRIGSNISFNIEFYKGNQNVEPLPVPTLDNRHKNREPGRRIHSRIVESKPIYSKSVGNDFKDCRDGICQADDIRTDNRSVGTVLNRCFCTLNLMKKKKLNYNQVKYNQVPIRNEKKTTQVNLKNENAQYFREKGIEANLKKHALLPYECEPNFCILGECDPYKCYERIQQRKTCSKCCGSDHPKSCDRCCNSHTNQNRSVYAHGDRRNKRPEKKAKMINRVVEKDHVQREYRDYGGYRQAVRIGSNISFNIEFLKDSQRGNEGRIPQAEHLKPIKKLRTIETNIDRTKVDKGAGEPKRDRRDADSQMVYQRKNTSSETEKMLKRCFCTLKFQQKPSSRQPATKAKYPNNPKVYNLATHRNTKSTKINTTSPKKFKLYNSLKPYECEPGFCIPGECNPYECLERIKKRNVRTTGTGTGRRHAVVSNIATPTKTRGTNALCKADRQNLAHSKPRQQSAVVEVPRFTNIFGKRNVQSVKIGSNFNFNIEFYKEVMPAQAIRTSDNYDHAPKKKTARHVDDGVCTASKRTRSKEVSHRPLKHNDQSSQMAGVQTECKGSGMGKVLKRCFCTLKFQNQNMAPMQQRVVTVGRVEIEEHRGNFHKKTHVNKVQDELDLTCSGNDMETVYVYKPKKIRVYGSKTILQDINKLINVRNQTLHCEQLNMKGRKMRNINKRNHDKKINALLLSKDQKAKIKCNNNISDEVYHTTKITGFQRYLNTFLTLFSRQGKVPYTSGILTGNNKKINKKYEKIYSSEPKLITQRKKCFLHKCSKSDHVSKKYDIVPPKKAISVIAGKTSRRESSREHRLLVAPRIDHYSHHQSGDAQRNNPKKVFGVNNIEHFSLSDLKHSKSKNFKSKHSPYSKKYVVGYTFKQSNLKKGACDECGSCTMKGCDCFQRLHKGNTKYGNNDLGGKVVSKSGNGCNTCKKKKCKCKSKEIITSKEVIKVKGPTVGHTFKQAKVKKGACDECESCTMKDCNCFQRLHKGNTNSNNHLDRKVVPKSGNGCICKKKKCKCKSKKENKSKEVKAQGPNALLKGKMPSPDSVKPLFVVNLDSSSCTIINRDEIMRNIAKVNKERKEAKEQTGLKSNFMTLKKRQKCVCGSSVCEEILSKMEDEANKETLKVKPCICGDEVCARVSQEETQASENTKGKKKPSRKKISKGKAKSKKPPKKKPKKIPKKKPKKKKPKKSIIQILGGKYKTWKKNRDKRNEYDKYMTIYRRAEKRRYDYHKKRIKTLAKRVKNQQSDLNTYLIGDSVIDLGSMGKVWISSGARRLYRAIGNPKYAYRRLKNLMEKPEHAPKTKSDYNTVELVTRSTFSRVGTRLGYTTCGKSIKRCLASTRIGHALLHLNKKKRPDFRPPRQKTEAERAAECNMYLASLRRKPCLWVYDRWPACYPRCLSALRIWKQFMEVILFLLAIVVWSPCIFCVEICRGLMCCTFCTQ